MGSTGRILRGSIHSFLKHFQVFSTTPALFLLPLSASVLLSSGEILNPPLSSLLVFTSISESVLVGCHVNLSKQTMFVFVYQLIFIAFTLSCFVMGKAFIIQYLNLNQLTHHKPSLFRPLMLTQLCSSVTFNMVCFFVSNSGLTSLGLSPSSLDVFMVLGSRVVLCAIWTNMVVISNLSLVVAATEDLTCFAAIYKACLLRKGNHSLALLVALPTNLCLAAIDGLFRFRILQVYHHGKYSADVALEGVFIAYLYSLLVVVDTIACCLFYKDCCCELPSFVVVADQSNSICYDIENVTISKS